MPGVLWKEEGGYYCFNSSWLVKCVYLKDNLIATMNGKNSTSSFYKKYLSDAFTILK